MSDKTDAWMPLWIGAYLADTMRLTTIQHGAYLLMLMAYWRDREPLIDDDEELRAITKTDKADWKKIRPVLAKFFKIENGKWWHKRVEQELVSAAEKQSKAKSKAQAAAQARWRDAPSSATSNAPSIPQAVHEECPTHTPTPSISVVESDSTHTEIYSEQAGEVCVPTPAGLVCRRMVELGIDPMSCNPGNPTLLVLLAAGATLAEFEGAARGAVQRGKGFNYVIGTVKKQREEAAKLVLHQGKMPNKQEALEGGNRAVAATWVPPELKTGTGGAA